MLLEILMLYCSGDVLIYFINNQFKKIRDDNLNLFL